MSSLPIFLPFVRPEPVLANHWAVYHVEVQHGGRVCLQVLAAAALELGLTTRLDRRPLEANFAVVLQ